MAKIRDNTKNVISEVDKLIKQRLKDSAILVERTAKQNLYPGHGLITGTLKRSINRRIERRRALIGSNVEYAPYVEMGTSKMSAKPYLRPALESNWSEIRKIFGAK